MATEHWHAVYGGEGIYEVSNFGNVRSLDRKLANGRSVRGRVLKPWPTWTGHLQVHLSLEGERVARSVHSLVLEAFVAPRPEGMVACHENDDPADNRVENLRWDTQQENVQDSIKRAHHRNARKTHCERQHPLEGPNLITSTKNHRRCRACARADSYARNVLKEPVTQQLADQYFSELAKEAA